MKAKKIILFFMIVLILIAGIYIFNDNKKVVNLIQANIVEDSIEIIDRENYISILPNIIDISDIYWIDNDTIQFKGMKLESNKYNSFSFNIKKKELTTISQNNMFFKKTDKSDSNEIFSIKIDDNSSLSYRKGSKNYGLFHIKNNGEPFKIANSIEYKNEYIFKLSNNNKKLAFYDSELDKMRIYTFDNNKMTDIDFEISEYILNNFDDALQFSWDAGYLCVENINNENINESSYSVFGADSGKIYGDKILGINPVWANNSLSIAFIYSKNDIDIIKDSSNSLDIAGSRLGILNLKTREIRYTEAIDSPNRIIHKPLWGSKDNKVFILLGIKENSNNYYIPTKIFEYSNRNNILADLNYNLNTDSFTLKGNQINFIQNNEKLILIGQSIEEDNIMISIDLDSRKMNIIQNLQYFNIYNNNISKKVLYTYLNNNHYMYISDNCIYTYNDDSSFLKYKSTENITAVYESPNRDKILIVTNLTNNTELSIIELLKY